MVAAPDVFLECCGKSGGVEAGHAVPECADAGENIVGAALQVFRPRADAGLIA
jgi:hypothetical protein